MFSFPEWSQTSLGQSLLMAEQNALGQFLPDLKGEIAVQYGYAGTSSMLDLSMIDHKFFVQVIEGQRQSMRTVPADNSADLQYLYVEPDSVLPLASSSVDLCLLPHMLDYSADPHQLLRESKEVLVSGGHLVIFGFNPYSLWGGRKLFSRKQPPWNSHDFSVYRVREWLSLLDFHISGGMMLYYSPPIQNQSLRERFIFLEQAGDRWWPMLGSVYLLIAQKRDPGMTVIDFRKNIIKSSFLNVAEPVAKNTINATS